MNDRNRNDFQQADYEFARYPIRLNLPQADLSLLETAAEAVRREYQETTRWKRLRCRAVQQLLIGGSAVIYELQVGSAIEFDWTWEGAVAFRPITEKTNRPVIDDRFKDDRYQADFDDSVYWAGEILEVDEAKRKIFISIANPEYPPTTGTFFVRPFEFLVFLNTIFQHPEYEFYRSMLVNRLLASEGNIHPKVESYRNVGLEELEHIWRTSWGILWGPPGTGKTYTTGKQIANILDDPSERILVLSTTNKATDAAALAIGRSVLAKNPEQIDHGRLLRVGKGASLRSFEAAGLEGMLKGTETEMLGEVEQLVASLAEQTEASEKAFIRSQIKDRRQKMRDTAKRNFFDRSIRTVVGTAFRATTFLQSDEVKTMLQQSLAPFTTVIIDEAGLISRASAAALSLLASRRVILVGDSKQLAPISRISRLLPSDQMDWLASSGVGHLRSLAVDTPGVHVLKKQHRMHETIGSLISRFQYDGCLSTADSVKQRQFAMPDLLEKQPRAIWYVLDESGEDLPTIRADRGKGNRSWIRPATPRILDLLFSDLTLRMACGMFISPFRGQVQAIADYLVKSKIMTWSAATVHSQQGSEADFVIFDTVNAGSYAWPYDEWKRLINVAISRAHEGVIVLASRAEMNEPFLRPLVGQLAARVLVKDGRKVLWRSVSLEDSVALANLDAAAGPLFDNRLSLLTQQFREPNSVGYQIASRKLLRPILSNEQQRLCGLDMDGKPRLVRGVAGSGKTVVLANWMMQTAKQIGDRSGVRIWAVFANRSLQGLIGDSLQSVWDEFSSGKSFPWESVSLHHVRELLSVLLQEINLSIDSFGFDYDQAAKTYLDRIPPEKIEPRCEAIFIDEAQDMGPNTLRLLSSLVRLTDNTDLNSRSVNIFYDNAQNVYARATPVWSDLGLDMRGRSSVMKESFRSTRPVSEFALNVLYSLQPPLNNPDHRELVQRDLLRKSVRQGRDWWSIAFNQVEGPLPTFQQYPTLTRQLHAIAGYIRKLVEDEQVHPNDICIVYMGRRTKQLLELEIKPLLAEFDVELSIQTNVPFAKHKRTLLASTPHSIKGYDAEIVIIPAADQFVSSAGEIQANSLYVAMTRARSMLSVYSGVDGSREALQLIGTLQNCAAAMHDTPTIDSGARVRDEFHEILDIIGPVHRDWLKTLWKQYQVSQEPILDHSGKVIAEPLFWFEQEGLRYACFGVFARFPKEKEILARNQITPLMPGQSLPD